MDIAYAVKVEDEVEVEVEDEVEVEVEDEVEVEVEDKVEDEVEDEVEVDEGDGGTEFIEIIKSLPDRDLAILFKTLQLENEKVQRRYMRDQKPTKMDGSLYNAYCARVLVADPNEFILQEILTRISLSKSLAKAEPIALDEIYYTFFYCYLHDDGWIILGNHDYAPDGYKSQCTYNCDYGDWHKQGLVMKNKQGGLTIVEEVRMNYDRFAGGFEFRLYQDTLTDETGQPLNMSDHPELKEWMEQNITF